jgi:hypothetical protein
MQFTIVKEGVLYIFQTFQFLFYYMKLCVYKYINSNIKYLTLQEVLFQKLKTRMFYIE